MNLLSYYNEFIGRSRDPIYRNSIYIILNSISSAGLGFIFWAFAARLFSADEVGVATVLISVITLLVQLSRFGLDQSMIRYIKEYSTGNIFFTSLFISTTFAILFGITFIAGIHIWSPELTIVREYPALFLGILTLYSVFSITATMYLALRDGKNYLFQSLIVGTRFFFLLPSVTFGAIGIILSYGVSLFLGLIYSGLNFMKWKIKYKEIDVLYLKTSLAFSGASYLGQLLINLPGLILPIIIINLLGAESSALFYMSYTIASILFMIPTAVSTSLFVEGSHGEPIPKNIKSAISLIMLLLVPGILILSAFRSTILGFFGEAYTAAISLYQLLLISSIFISVVHIYIALQKIRKNNRKILYLSISLFTLLAILSVTFIQMYGLIGVGYAWIVGYAVCSLPLLKSIKQELV